MRLHSSEVEEKGKSKKMKKKTKGLREKTKEELLSLLEEKRRDLLRYGMELAAAKLKNVKKISRIKKEIARILTIIKEKEIGKN